MSKDNPLPLSRLTAILNLPKAPKIPRGITKRNMREYYRLQAIKKNIGEQRRKVLNKYRVGSFKEYEGDGYFKKNLYLYNGEYYG